MKKLILHQEKEIFLHNLINVNYPDGKKNEILEEISILMTDLIEEFYIKLVGKDTVELLKNINYLSIKKMTSLPYLKLLGLDVGGDYYPNLILNKGVIEREIPITTEIHFEIVIRKQLPDSCYIEEIYNKKCGKLKYENNLLKDLKNYVDKNKWLELITLIEDYFEFSSLQKNYTHKTKLALFSISTEEELKKSYPDLYEQYEEFSKAQKKDDNKQHIIRSGRDVKDILEEYRSLLV